MVAREKGRAPLLRTSIISDSRPYDFEGDKRREEGSVPLSPSALNLRALMRGLQWCLEKTGGLRTLRLRWW